MLGSYWSLSTQSQNRQVFSENEHRFDRKPFSEYNNSVRVQKTNLRNMLPNLVAPNQYKELLKLYESGKLPVSEGVALFQFLIDTEQCWDDVELSRVANYLISEGFCYYVYTP